MASTLYQYLLPRLQAREKAREQRYKAYRQAARTQRIDGHVKRLETIVNQLSPKEREEIDAELAALEMKRQHAEHLERYREMNAAHQHAFRTQWTQ